MKWKTWIFSLLLTLAIAAPASADVIYDSGAPNFGVTAWNISNYYTAGDFSFNTATSVNAVTFWTSEDPTSYLGNIFYSIFKDVSGKPSETLLVPWAEAGSLVRTSIGTDVYGLHTYQYIFDIAPFAAAAGETYWLSIHNGAPTDFSGDGRMFWSTTGALGTQGSPNSYMYDARNGGEWHLVSAFDQRFTSLEVAFQLSGTGAPIPTPEPATMLLFGLGGLALPFARRLRKKA